MSYANNTTDCCAILDLDSIWSNCKLGEDVCVPIAANFGVSARKIPPPLATVMEVVFLYLCRSHHQQVYIVNLLVV